MGMSRGSILSASSAVHPSPVGGAFSVFLDTISIGHPRLVFGPRPCLQASLFLRRFLPSPEGGQDRCDGQWAADGQEQLHGGWDGFWFGLIAGWATHPCMAVSEVTSLAI